jgi:hypothetical protein
MKCADLDAVAMQKCGSDRTSRVIDCWPEWRSTSEREPPPEETSGSMYE